MQFIELRSSLLNEAIISSILVHRLAPQVPLFYCSSGSTTPARLFFFGAGFTKVYTKTMGYQLKPAKHAKWSPQIILAEELRRIVPSAEPSESKAGKTIN